MKAFIKRNIPELIVTFVCLTFIGMMIYPARHSRPYNPQASSKNNLKQIGVNIVAYFADLKTEGKTLKFPPLGKDTNDDSIIDTELSALEGLPSHCPFYKLPYTYSKEKINDYIIDEAQIISEAVLTENINIFIIKGAKAHGEKGAPRYAPLKLFALRGDFSIGDQNK